MGMYTSFGLGVALKSDTPKSIIYVLQSMCGMGNFEEVYVLSDNPLFKTERWKYMLQGATYYSPIKGSSYITQKPYTRVYDLSVISDLKNYDDEIDHFLKWIEPYVLLNHKEWVGWYKYEERVYPTLIMYDDYNSQFYTKEYHE